MQGDKPKLCLPVRCLLIFFVSVRVFSGAVIKLIEQNT